MRYSSISIYRAKNPAKERAQMINTAAGPCFVKRAYREQGIKKVILKIID